MAETIDWPQRSPKPRRRGRILLIATLAAIVFGGGTVLSYYVEALWFESLGYVDVFWKTLNLQGLVFGVGFLVTFVTLYGSYLVLKPARLGELIGVPILINGQPLKLPVEPVLRLIALGFSLAIAAVTGTGPDGRMADAGALLVRAGRGDARRSDFRPAAHLLFLHAARLATRLRLAHDAGVDRLRRRGLLRRRHGRTGRAHRPPQRRAKPAWRGLSVSFALLLLMLAFRVFLGRFERLFAEHTIFTGITYTDAHISVTGTLIVAWALVVGAAMALVNAVAAPRLRWLVAAVVPTVVCYFGVSVTAWYVNSFIVKPNELVREQPYISHNIALTRDAYALTRIAEHPFPADTGVDAVDPANNQATLQNIRLWDWRALQDTLRQIQEIRTYYDFPDIDIDRYEIDGTIRQMMLATRELNVEKLPESSRNWINEKLIYTHGYGVTMNPVNGFTPEGLPTLVLSNMPVQSTTPSIKVTRPEVYFGELTNTDVYVRTRQKEFNYPQGRPTTSPPTRARAASCSAACSAASSSPSSRGTWPSCRSATT